ncbi:Hsp20/alpha crystallin family protein [Candidatus Micrarchaeota archaeon]|nr:Hsp20/alpha crystallin family protein [Candidatus Micrarchaeota archaeon]
MKKKKWTFNDIFMNLFKEMEEMQEKMMKDFADFEDFEKMMEKGKPGKMAVRGVSIKIGPDGKPVIREFGNIPPQRKAVKEIDEGEREPLVDVVEGEKEVIVVAEVPGVTKQDITLKGDSKKLEIDVDGKKRNYYKKIEFKKAVDYKKKKMEYKNGILEVRIPVKK